MHVSCGLDRCVLYMYLKADDKLVGYEHKMMKIKRLELHLIGSMSWLHLQSNLPYYTQILYMLYIIIARPLILCAAVSVATSSRQYK